MVLKGKKAMYFTIMTIVFLVIFLFFFLKPSYQELSSAMPTVEMRVTGVNNFIKSVERDIERGLYISSFRALLSLESYLIQKGQFLTDADKSFKEALLNGTINGENATLMQSSKLGDWVNSMEKEGEKLNLHLNISIKNIDLYQKDPWHVAVGVNFSLFVNDATGIASWYRLGYKETSIDIVGFEDPLYIVNGLGRMTNAINKTIFENNYTYKINTTWNVTNLLKHIENSLYTSHTDAPSFLMRFENNIAPSQYGIESLVNIKKLSEQDLEVDPTSSIVDYHYWSGAGNGNYRINFTPAWVKIDSAHRVKYNVTAVSYPIIG